MRRQASAIAVADAVIWCSAFLLAALLAYVASAAAFHRLPTGMSNVLFGVTPALAGAAAFTLPLRWTRSILAGVATGVFFLALVR